MQDEPDAANLQEGITIQQKYPTDEISDTDTLEAISELEGNGGALFTSSAKNFFKMLIKSED